MFQVIWNVWMTLFSPQKWFETGLVEAILKLVKLLETIFVPDSGQDQKYSHYLCSHCRTILDTGFVKTAFTLYQIWNMFKNPSVWFMYVYQYIGLNGVCIYESLRKAGLIFFSNSSNAIWYILNKVSQQLSKLSRIQKNVFYSLKIQFSKGTDLDH